jgi:hypothetical protein
METENALPKVRIRDLVLYYLRLDEFSSLLMSGSCQGEAESQSGGKHPVSGGAADAPSDACVDGEVG